MFSTSPDRDIHPHIAADRLDDAGDLGHAGERFQLIGNFAEHLAFPLIAVEVAGHVLSVVRLTIPHEIKRVIAIKLLMAFC